MALDDSAAKKRVSRSCFVEVFMRELVVLAKMLSRSNHVRCDEC